MTIYTAKTPSKFSKRSSKVLCSTLIVLAVSPLLACSQADNIDANDANTPQDKTSEVMVTKTEVLATTVANTQSQSLKNVSATVYKDPNCGCCKEWVDYAEGNGLTAAVQHPEDLSLFKDRSGVPESMRSCHTAVTTDGFVFEGHVPAKHMAEFLANPPTQALGLAVPGMPVGSPGMEYQDKFAPYQVMQLNKDGSTEVYADIKTVQQQL